MSTVMWLADAKITASNDFFCLYENYSHTCYDFVNGVRGVKSKMRPSHIMLRYVDVGDSELIQLAHNSRECQLSNKTLSSPFGS